MPSVTTTIENLELEGPILEVHFLISSDLENKYRIANIPIPEPVIVKALVDTGASSCIIQSKIPTDLKLEPIGKITINIKISICRILSTEDLMICINISRPVLTALVFQPAVA